VLRTSAVVLSDLIRAPRPGPITGNERASCLQPQRLPATSAPRSGLVAPIPSAHRESSPLAEALRWPVGTALSKASADTHEISAAHVCRIWLFEVKGAP